MNFKKHICLLLTSFLLVSYLGLAFNVHYCDDEIASITLNTLSSSQEIEDNCCGEVEKQSKCCNDKIIKAEIKSDQIISNTSWIGFILDPYSWRPTFFTSNKNFKNKNLITYYCDAHAPPLFLLYSQFTFYC